jgi:hypothetical protein
MLSRSRITVPLVYYLYNLTWHLKFKTFYLLTYSYALRNGGFQRRRSAARDCEP